MNYRKLGHSDLKVSRICLGTMTWGFQNSVEEAASQLDLALDHGVNFLDTAEIYPVPPTPDKAGRTEEFIGEWLSASGKRDEYIIATKMAGPGFIRDGRGLKPEDVAGAVDGSLKRLGIETIDLYQLHWPQRQANYFAQRDFQPDKHRSFAGEDIKGMLAALQKEIEKGKIRYIGVSNETPWGIMEYLNAANLEGLPRIVSSQNPYSLMQRNWDVHLSEFAARERVDLLAYSPLAGGILSGKYLEDGDLSQTRFGGAWGNNMMEKHAQNKDSDHVRFYAELAKDNGMTPTQLAIAWVNHRLEFGSNIIGATSDAQLKEVLSAEEIVLSDEIINAIEEYHDQHPSPSLARGGMRDAQ